LVTMPEVASWDERFKDPRRKSLALNVIRMTAFTLLFAQTVVLPSLSSYLSVFHADVRMLGFCLAATCFGEIFAAPLFNFWYDRRPTKEVILSALVLNLVASLCYSMAPNKMAVLASRFFVGCANGVQGVLLTMAAGLSGSHNRLETLTSIRAMYTVALVLGTGLAAVGTFVHMPAPGPLGHIHHQLPKYFGEMASNATAHPASIGASTGIWIPANGRRRLLAAAAAPAQPPRPAERLAEKPAPTGPARPRAREADGAGRDMRTAGLQRIAGAAGRDLAGAARAMGRDLHKVGAATHHDLGLGRIRVTAGDVKDAAETDRQLAERIGGHRMYMPAYLTAVVGHGYKAPGCRPGPGAGGGGLEV
jgi:MFS family permease